MRWWWLCQNSVVATINHKNSNKHMAGVQEGGLVVDVAWRWHPMCLCQGEQGAMNNILLHGVMINDAGGWGGGNCNSARWLSRGPLLTATRATMMPATANDDFCSGGWWGSSRLRLRRWQANPVRPPQMTTVMKRKTTTMTQKTTQSQQWGNCH